MISVGILTVSDSGARGEQKDLSGTTLIDMVSERLDAKIKKYEIVPAERQAIQRALVEWVDVLDLDLILTAGESAFAAEAMRAVIEREAPELADTAKQPQGMLSQAAAGIRGHTLIVNLPGSPNAVEETFNVILPALPQVIGRLRAEPAPVQGQ